MAELVLQTVREPGVLLVTLNRPEVMNALTAEMVQELRDAFIDACTSDHVRAVVITGAGRGFCSGADAGKLLARGPGEGRPSRHARMDRRGDAGALIEAMAACDVPIVAALNGPAAGAGFGLALSCDIRIAAESAKIGTVFIKRGTASDFGTAFWLPRIVGLAAAFDLFYSGDLIDPATALRMGLVHRVVPDQQLLEEALAYASRIAAGPPLAYTAVRRMLLRSMEMPLHQFLEYEWTNQLDLLGTQDCIEGFTSFVERRAPKFEGR